MNLIMGTSWEVEVIDRGEKWLDLRLTQYSPDAGPFPENGNFALQLLVAEAYTFNDANDFVPKCALGRAIDHGHPEALLPDELEPVVSNFIQQVRVYRAQNLPWSEDTWDGESPMPMVTYRITVTDPQWIEHLKPGASFSSAAFWEEFMTDWDEFAVANNRVHQEWICTNRDIEPNLPNDRKEGLTQLLPVVERSTPLSGAYTGDRSVRLIRFENGQLLAGCPAAAEIHSMSLATGDIQSRSAEDSEFDEFDNDEIALDALEDGIIRREGHPDIVLADAPELTYAISLPTGFLVQVDYAEFLYVSNSGEYSKTDILSAGGRPVLYGNQVLIPYQESSQVDGWLLWDAETQRTITSHMRRTGPECTAVWHGKEGRVLAWCSPSAEDSAVADKVWLEFEPA